MKTKILVTVLVAAIFAACKKDTFQSKPQLTFKKVNASPLVRNQPIIFTIEVTDAEGDIQDSMFIQKVVKDCALSNFTDKHLMPQFTATKNFKADIEISYSYSDIGPKCNRNDTATFRFWLKDRAKNTSDTLVSPLTVILR